MKVKKHYSIQHPITRKIDHIQIIEIGEFEIKVKMIPSGEEVSWKSSYFKRSIPMPPLQIIEDLLPFFGFFPIANQPFPIFSNKSVYIARCQNFIETKNPMSLTIRFFGYVKVTNENYAHLKELLELLNSDPDMAEKGIKDEFIVCHTIDELIDAGILIPQYN